MTPEEVLFDYLAAMAEWETKCRELSRERKAGRIDSRESFRTGMSYYRPIFERYCSATRATPRVSLAFASPPEHDPSAVRITKVDISVPKAAEIWTEQTTHHNTMLYRFALEHGEWKLFGKFYVARDGEMIEEEL